MSEILRLLHVEDSESDSGLILRVLQRAGYELDTHRVEDPEEMRAALNRQTWDLIIADHSMARFSAPAALSMLHEHGLDIPFVVVSGSIGEEIAVEMMKAGAHDYVLKDNLARLAPAVERELREAGSRRDRRLAEQALRDSEERLALAIGATQLGTFDFSPVTGRLIWSGTAYRHFGLTPQAAISYETFLQGIHPDDRDRVAAAAETLLAPGNEGQYEIEYRTLGIEDRVERQIYTWGRVIFDEAGQAVRVVGVTQDISERKRLEDQLRQAQKLETVGRLAGGIAHDFNNLLTVINGYSDMLTEQLPLDEPLREYAKEIRTAGERGAALSSQLLILNRKHHVRPKEVALNDIVAEVAKMLERVIGEKIRIESVLSSVAGSVLADPGQLHQVLMNLAVNARDAMPNGGTLLIETANVSFDDGSAGLQAGMPPGPYLQLTVRDTGVGMTEEVMSHLFEPFFTTKKVGEGTGLGLATVYGIVKRIGGWIAVSSVKGEGTAFNIYLPRVDATAEAERQPDAKPLGGTETILVVEDQEQVRKMAARVLRGHGYRVIEAAHPGEALLQSERHAGPIHLLLTDVVMPEMTGPELAERMKLSRPEIAIIFMSGYSERVLVNRRMLESRGSYLAKPFSPDELAFQTRAALDPWKVGKKGTAAGADF